MSSNPLRHVGQTARPEEEHQAEDPADEAARRQKPSDAPVAPAAQGREKPQASAKTEIPDLEPGEPPPESSAGS